MSIFIRIVENGYVAENMSNNHIRISTNIEDLLVHVRDLLAEEHAMNARLKSYRERAEDV